MNWRPIGHDSASNRRFTKSQEMSTGSTVEKEDVEITEMLRKLMYQYDLQFCLHRAVKLRKLAVQTNLPRSTQRDKTAQPTSFGLLSNYDSKHVKVRYRSTVSKVPCKSESNSGASVAIKNGNAKSDESWDSDDSETLQSGFLEGHDGVDLDAMKSAISRLSLFQKAFFNENQDEFEEYHQEEPNLSKLLTKFRTEMTEVHLSNDQSDGSEIIAPSWHTGLPFSCLVSAWFDCRRQWLASLGHISAGPSDSVRHAELCFGSGDDGRLLLQLTFEHDEICNGDSVIIPSTGLVFRLSRLANNLRRHMYSNKRIKRKPEKE